MLACFRMHEGGVVEGRPRLQAPAPMSDARADFFGRSMPTRRRKGATNSMMRLILRRIKKVHQRLSEGITGIELMEEHDVRRAYRAIFERVMLSRRL